MPMHRVLILFTSLHADISRVTRFSCKIRAWPRRYKQAQRHIVQGQRPPHRPRSICGSRPERRVERDGDKCAEDERHAGDEPAASGILCEPPTSIAPPRAATAACPRSNIPCTTVTPSSQPAAASACTRRRSTSRPSWPAKDSGSRRSTRRPGRQLHGLRPRIHQLGAENPATYRQPVRHTGVTHVSGPDTQILAEGVSALGIYKGASRDVV